MRARVKNGQEDRALAEDRQVHRFFKVEQRTVIVNELQSLDADKALEM